MPGSAPILLSLVLLAALAQPAAATALPQNHVDLADDAASADTRRLAGWIVMRDDAQGLPFILVDKPNARVFVFTPSGRSLGSAPVLLGVARGDVSAPGIGTRKLADIPPSDRITPAGRFAAGMGVNLAGKDILWVDYDAAISLHRVVTANAAERRLQRLATPSPQDNRISYGCINVPVRFYDDIVRPMFAAHGGIVYVMPDAGTIDEVFTMGGVANVTPSP